MSSSREARVSGVCSAEEQGGESQRKAGGRWLRGLGLSNRSSFGRVVRTIVRLEDVLETLEGKSWRQ